MSKNFSLNELNKNKPQIFIISHKHYLTSAEHPWSCNRAANYDGKWWNRRCRNAKTKTNNAAPRNEGVLFIWFQSEKHTHIIIYYINIGSSNESHACIVWYGLINICQSIQFRVRLAKYKLLDVTVFSNRTWYELCAKQMQLTTVNVFTN